MRQMLLSEGEGKEEIHYSSTPWRTHEGIEEQLSPRETEGQRPVGCCLLDMDPALKGAATTEHFHWKRTLSGWRGGGGGEAPTF